MVNHMLNDIAEVMVGLVLTRRQQEDEKAISFKYKALNLKCLNNDGWIEVDDLDHFNSKEELTDRYLTLEGDIVIKLTTPYTTGYISKDLEGLVVPSQFAIIRTKDDLINPEYLSMYLNSEKVKHDIWVSSTGVVVPVLKISELREFIIPVPNEIRQEQIADINRLMIKEMKLYEELIKEKELYNKEILSRLLEDKENE